MTYLRNSCSIGRAGSPLLAALAIISTASIQAGCLDDPMLSTIDQESLTGAAMAPQAGQTLRCDVLVVGGSTAAATAALGAAREGIETCLVQPRNVIGGQFTAQGLPATDDGPIAQKVGDRYAFSQSQRGFRQRQRELQPRAGKVFSNPGECWVSRLCTGPEAARIALEEQLAPYINSQQLRIVSNSVPTAVLMDTSGSRPRVTGVGFRDTERNSEFRVDAAITIEATDLGDLLELGNIDSRVGQEARSDTGEPLLPQTACPECQQAFTYGIFLERTALGEGTLLPKPDGYNSHPWLTNYTATLWKTDHNNQVVPVDFLANYGYFNYRRLVVGNPDARNGSDGAIGDITMINIGCQAQGAGGAIACGNDYGGDAATGGALVGVSRAQRDEHLRQARERALGYIYYIQTTAASNTRPVSELSGTPDGIALDPYIREARRGVAVTTVRYQDVAEIHFPGQSRGRMFQDSVGIGDYHYLDVHPNNATGHIALTSAQGRSLPFSIPATALVPINTDGLVLSSKSIGTTHITNAAYRMHPVEWAIGEASGALAAHAVANDVEPRAIADHAASLRSLQSTLAAHGVPLYWFDDVAHDDIDFEAIQVLAAAGVIIGDSFSHLHYSPASQINRAQAAFALVAAMGLPVVNPAAPSFSDVPASHWAYPAIETLRARGVISGFGDGTFRPEAQMSREHLSFMVKSAVGAAVTDTAFRETPINSQPTLKRELARVMYVIYLAFL